MTVDLDLDTVVHAEPAIRRVEVLAGTTVQAISIATAGERGRLHVEAITEEGVSVTRIADLVLVLVGMRPDTCRVPECGPVL